MANEKANQNTHSYTCLASPPALEELGLTHMVCRVDMPDRPVAAFNSSQAASMQCDSLNGFAKQDRPELLGPDDVQRELEEANRLALEREKQSAKMGAEGSVAPIQGTNKVIELSLADKVAAAQQASVVKN